MFIAQVPCTAGLPAPAGPISTHIYHFRAALRNRLISLFLAMCFFTYEAASTRLGGYAQKAPQKDGFFKHDL